MNIHNTAVMIWWINYIAKIVANCSNNEKRFDEYVRSGTDDVWERQMWYSKISTKNLVLHQYIVTNINIMSQVSMMIHVNIHKLQLCLWLYSLKNKRNKFQFGLFYCNNLNNYVLNKWDMLSVIKKYGLWWIYWWYVFVVQSAMTLQWKILLLGFYC